MAGPGNKERTRKPTHETETKLSNGGNAMPAFQVPLRSGHSPCLELFFCCGSLAGWAEDFLCDSGDGVTEPALLSDDQLSQTLHCTLHHHSFHFPLLPLLRRQKDMTTHPGFSFSALPPSISVNDRTKVSMSRTPPPAGGRAPQ